MHTVLGNSLSAADSKPADSRRATLVPRFDEGTAASMEMLATLSGALAEVFAQNLKRTTFDWQVQSQAQSQVQVQAQSQAQAQAQWQVPSQTPCQLSGLGQRNVRRVLEEKNDRRFALARPLAELRHDNSGLLALLRSAQAQWLVHDDSASADQLAAWVVQAEKRDWFLRQATCRTTT